MKLIPALLIVLLASCEREPLTLAQGQTIEQLNPGATVRPFPKRVFKRLILRGRTYPRAATLKTNRII